VGNEIVFYSVFPILLILMRSKAGVAAVGLGALIIHAYFAFFVLDPAQNISSQSPQYMSPLNQLFFFISGLLIGKLSTPAAGSKARSIVALTLGLLLFCAWPAEGDRIQLISGFTRLVLTAACVLVCWSVFTARWGIAGRTGKLLKILGDTSYSTYLLHGPIAIWALDNIYSHLAIFHSHQGRLVFFVTLCAPITFAAAYLSFRKFELPLMRLGQRGR